MKLRQHRGTLADSMATTVEIEATMPALLAVVRSELPLIDVKADMLLIRPYAFDDRNGWDTHIVIIDGHGIYGFTDGPLQT